MKLITIVFSLLLGQPIFSQEYKQYAQLINKAEISAIHDSFSTSLNYYQQAFSLYKNGFCKDYYNAAVCAEKLNNQTIASEYLNKVYQTGYSFDSIQNKEVFKDLIKSKEFKKIFND